jgi:hypothetical protein
MSVRRDLHPAIRRSYDVTSAGLTGTRHAATPKHSVSIKLVSNSNRTEKKWLTCAPGTERPSSTDTGA